MQLVQKYIIYFYCLSTQKIVKTYLNMFFYHLKTFLAIICFHSANNPNYNNQKAVCEHECLEKGSPHCHPCSSLFVVSCTNFFFQSSHLVSARNILWGMILLMSTYSVSVRWFVSLSLVYFDCNVFFSALKFELHNRKKNSICMFTFYGYLCL